MISKFGIKLLKLTRTRRRISIAKLQKELPLTEEELHAFLTQLREKGLLSFSADVVEQNSTQRLTLAEELIRNGRDSHLVSQQLLWQEFEDFIEAALYKNGYSAARHIVFNTHLGRREIDVLAWNDVWILAVDCKHWSRNLTHARMRNAAKAQAQRADALAAKPHILQRQGIRRLDAPLVPLILSLGETRENIIDGIPIVAISEFASFLHEASPYDSSFKTFTVKHEPTQRTLPSLISNQSMTEDLICLKIHGSPKTLIEVEQRLQHLTNAVLAGSSEEAQQKTYAALAIAKPNEILDAVIEAVNILLDLNELGGADQKKFKNVENSINACLQVIQDALNSSEGKFDFTATVGPIGLEGGHLLCMAIAALLRSVGFKAIGISKSQTALELLRNSEELRADLVLPLLPKNDLAAHMLSLQEEIERGGFGKFLMIPIARGLSESITSPIYVAKNVDEAVSKALEWAIKNSVAE
ncbi:MAG: restriction endonuclease [Candidatus Bathyarchaeia archaeon]